jgi:hypothetical protein
MATVRKPSVKNRSKPCPLKKAPPSLAPSRSISTTSKKLWSICQLARKAHCVANKQESMGVKEELERSVAAYGDEAGIAPRT